MKYRVIVIYDLVDNEHGIVFQDVDPDLEKLWFHEFIYVTCGNRINAKKYAEKDFYDMASDIAPDLNVHIEKIIINDYLTDKAILEIEAEYEREYQAKQDVVRKEREELRIQQEYWRQQSFYREQRKKETEKQKALDFSNLTNSFNPENQEKYLQFLNKYKIRDWGDLIEHQSEVFQEKAFSAYMKTKIATAIEKYTAAKNES